MMLEHEANPAENPFLIAICFASLRPLLITPTEAAQAQTEDGTADGEIER